MKEIMLASANAHKAQEFEEMLRPLGYTVKTLLDLKEDIEIEETGTTFEENALIKAKAIHERLGIEVIADDSGLAVNALDGAPGIYSARFMGRDTSYDVKNQYLIDQCRHAEDKGCQFICAIAYVQADGSEHVFTGVVEGIVADHMEGAKGFGYDPIFVPSQEDEPGGQGRTSAQMSAAEKNAISHRGQALRALAPQLAELF